MRRPPARILVLMLAALVLVLYGCSRGGAPAGLDGAASVDKPPAIAPDYTGVTIPANIAPMNFAIKEPGEEHYVEISGDQGNKIGVRASDAKVIIPVGAWRGLLEANRGGKIRIDVYVKSGAQWTRFATVENSVASEPIDGYLAYRLIKPLYNYWRNIGVYQRDLSGYDQWRILHGYQLADGCTNCHTFHSNSTDRMTLGVRSSTFGSCTLVTRGDKVTKIDSKWGYNSWHPTGKVVAYSLNKVRQFFHGGGVEVRDVVDLDSDIVVYNDETQEVTTCPALADPDRLETYPCWSADGRYLYYCSAPFPWEARDEMPPDNYEQARYDLCRVSYDPDTGKFGDEETVLSAEKLDRCIMLPRVSPDGRFLLFCTTDYGCFPIYQPASDLCMLDLKTGEHRRLDINSDRSESWHSWSSNSRWIAFSSKRRDGLFTRSFISYVDESGRVHKPFVLPQKDPAFYDSFLCTYTVPELVKERVQTTPRGLAEAAKSKEAVALELPDVSMTQKQGPDRSGDAWQQGSKR